MNDLFNKIKEITELQATSGHEGPVRTYLKEKMTAMGYTPEFDGLGGIFVRLTAQDSGAPTVMIAAHMDEVGFLVSAIKSDGTLRVVTLGGWNPLVVSAQRFTLFTTQGDKIPVISGGIPPHLMRGTGKEPTLPAISDIVFDAGFENAAEAVHYGVAIGDVLVPQTETILTANGKNVMGKSWDNRYGCLEILELLAFLKGKTPAVNLIIGANVQEEVGLRGAKVSSTKFQPDLFFAVDCSPAGDTFGDDNGKLDGGVTMRYYDPGHIMLPGMKAFLQETASKNQIKTQPYIAKGGTDAGAAHLSNGGIPSTTIGVCARYIHSHQTLWSLDDFTQAQRMLQAITTCLTPAQVDQIKKY
ncbi:MAG: glutamyl aminopeptidase [Streptococcaceae bacterium]|nr:glutamyl aminopeptidase [Streptococcaceae bacterium]